MHHDSNAKASQLNLIPKCLLASTTSDGATHPPVSVAGHAKQHVGPKPRWLPAFLLALVPLVHACSTSPDPLLPDTTRPFVGVAAVVGTTQGELVDSLNKAGYLEWVRVNGQPRRIENFDIEVEGVTFSEPTEIMRWRTLFSSTRAVGGAVTLQPVASLEAGRHAQSAYEVELVKGYARAVMPRCTLTFDPTYPLPGGYYPTRLWLVSEAKVSVRRRDGVAIGGSFELQGLGGNVGLTKDDNESGIFHAKNFVLFEDVGTVSSELFGSREVVLHRRHESVALDGFEVDISISGIEADSLDLSIDADPKVRLRRSAWTESSNGRVLVRLRPLKTRAPDSDGRPPLARIQIIYQDPGTMATVGTGLKLRFRKLASMQVSDVHCRRRATGTSPTLLVARFYSGQQDVLLPQLLTALDSRLPQSIGISCLDRTLSIATTTPDKLERIAKEHGADVIVYGDAVPMGSKASIGIRVWFADPPSSTGAIQAGALNWANTQTVPEIHAGTIDLGRTVNLVVAGASAANSDWATCLSCLTNFDADLTPAVRGLRLEGRIATGQWHRAYEDADALATVSDVAEMSRLAGALATRNGAPRSEVWSHYSRALGLAPQNSVLRRLIALERSRIDHAGRDEDLINAIGPEIVAKPAEAFLSTREPLDAEQFVGILVSVSGLLDLSERYIRSDPPSFRAYVDAGERGMKVAEGGLEGLGNRQTAQADLAEAQARLHVLRALYQPNHDCDFSVLSEELRSAHACLTRFATIARANVALTSRAERLRVKFARNAATIVLQLLRHVIPDDRSIVGEAVKWTTESTKIPNVSHRDAANAWLMAAKLEMAINGPSPAVRDYYTEAERIIASMRPYGLLHLTVDSNVAVYYWRAASRLVNNQVEAESQSELVHHLEHVRDSITALLANISKIPDHYRQEAREQLTIDTSRMARDLIRWAPQVPELELSPRLLAESVERLNNVSKTIQERPPRLRDIYKFKSAQDCIGALLDDSKARSKSTLAWVRQRWQEEWSPDILVAIEEELTAPEATSFHQLQGRSQETQVRPAEPTAEPKSVFTPPHCR